MSSSASSLCPALVQTDQHSHSPQDARSSFGYDYGQHSPAISMPSDTTRATNAIATAVAVPVVASTVVQPSSITVSTALAPDNTESNSPPPMTLSVNRPIPLSAYISLSQVAISSALKVAMISTSLSLGVARTIVSGIDKVLGIAVKSAVGQNDEGSRGLSPASVASLPFRAALLGINFSDILVQTILETVDGSVNLALTTVQDGLDLMDTLFGPDSTSQTGETFREVWAIISREFTTSTDGEGGAKGGYPALEGMRLLMAYVAIQFATSEQWETIRVRTQGRPVGECLESKDEELGSSTAWSATEAWPAEWTRQGFGGMTTEELLQEERWLELREQREGRSAASFSPISSGSRLGHSVSPNPELTNFLAASYRFSRFCSAMYGSMFLEIMGAPERYPPHVPTESTSYTSGAPAPATAAPSSERSGNAATANNADDHHFHHYTGTPLGSILYSSDTAATIQDGFYSPRYYLLDDVDTKQIVLVLRGTKSLHDVMIDLTCDGADLWLDHDTTPLRDAHGNIVVEERLVEVEVSYGPGINHNNDDTRSNSSKGAIPRKRRPFRVHTGFLKAARTIASAETIGIQEKVKAALEARPDYSLLLIGHSLGAGIASVLSMLWADPATGLTPEMPSHSQGASSSRNGNRGTGGSPRDFYLPGYLPLNNADSFLPPGRRVRCYAYGSPKIMCPRLSKRAIKLVTSISYGDDVVGRLSLGSVRNIGHAMRALLAMRPAPPPSPPASASPSPPSSPTLDPSSTDVELLHDSSETLGDLLEQEGEGVNPSEQQQQEARYTRRRERREKRSKDKPAQQSIGLEIVQKVIRWRLTKEEHLFDEFMDIRRAMHREMEKYQETSDGGDFYTDDQDSMMEELDMSMVTPVLVPAGKVLWIRPTTLEKELENQETKEHPFESVLHQFEWDHPLRRDPASLLVPTPISQQLQSHLQDDPSDSASMRTFKSTVRSGLFSAPVSSSTLPSQTRPPAAATPLASAETAAPMVGDSHHLRTPVVNRRTSLDSVATFTTGVSATTTSPTSLHPGSQNTDKLLYRMYAVPQPEHVFDEMLFSRRMWSDHLPLTYEFILAGKHAIPVTNTESST
ncbi:hypothetical protein KVV02_002679 [Mortierella alpina]|uniref:sn-1-specific diacylglycerol lipase n=1 Tax=Mortierella alpina TaxID=64518 RepID=A0A9P8IEA9_MORAP|nr:hypothetical protein KVV02_002679 [Mortierella alpina]